MIFPSSVARDILLRLLDPAADGVDNSATTIWSKSLNVLARCQRILSIYYPASRHRISKALSCTSKVMFAVFAFGGPLIIAPAASNGLDLSGGHGRGGGEEDESFLSFEELLLGAGRAQESQRSGLRLGGDKGANTDSSSSVHSRSDGSTSEQGERRCSLSTPPTSVAGSEAGYNPWNPRSQISVLTDDAYLDVPSSARSQKIPSLILLHSLLPSSRWHTTHKSAFKTSSLVTPVEGKRKGTRKQVVVQTTSSHTLSDRPLRRQLLNRHWFRGGLRSEKTP